MPISLCRFRGRRGNSVAVVLFMLALVLGGAIFVWQQFGRTRHLIQAGNEVTVMKEYNQTADMEYRRHFRERNRANVQQCRRDTGLFLADTVRGKYNGRRDAFDQCYEERLQQLLDSINELDSNEVPPQFFKAHVKLSTSHRPLYECLQQLKQGYKAEGAEQRECYSKARRFHTEGFNMSEQAENDMLRLMQQ